MTDSLAVPPLQYYAIVRSQIEHEDNLVGQRLSWFVAAQSFLFTAYAITVSNIRPDNHPSPSRIQQSMLMVVPLVALLTCLLLSITIIAGLVAIANLRRLFDSHVPQPAQHRLPPIQGYRHTRLFGQAGPILLPYIFAAAWVYLIVMAK
jgi:hypothetical protein